MEVTLEKILMSDPCAYWRAPSAIEEVLSKIDGTSWLSATVDVIYKVTNGPSCNEVWKTLLDYTAARFPGAVGSRLLQEAATELTYARARISLSATEDRWQWLRLLAWPGDLASLRALLGVVTESANHVAGDALWMLQRQQAHWTANAVAVVGARLASACLETGDSEPYRRVILLLARRIDEEEAKQVTYTLG